MPATPEWHKALYIVAMTEKSMALSALVVQHPPQAAQLVLMFHGEFTTARAMLPCAQALAATFPQAMVACIEAPYAAADESRRQWWPETDSVPDEDAWQALVREAMAPFLQTIAYWQKASGVGPEATALVGFGQGATLVLESTQVKPAPASRVMAIAGRFADLPEDDRYRGTIHFLHGKNDATVPYQYTLEAAYHLRDMGMDLTAKVIPLVGHELHPEFVEATVQQLSQHISRHLLVEAGQSAQPPAQQAE